MRLSSTHTLLWFTYTLRNTHNYIYTIYINTLCTHDMGKSNKKKPYTIEEKENTYVFPEVRKRKLKYFHCKHSILPKLCEYCSPASYYVATTFAAGRSSVSSANPMVMCICYLYLCVFTYSLHMLCTLTYLKTFRTR